MKGKKKASATASKVKTFKDFIKASNDDLRKRGIPIPRKASKKSSSIKTFQDFMRRSGEVFREHGISAPLTEMDWQATDGFSVIFAGTKQATPKEKSIGTLSGT
jgi:hypothetical protein